MDPNATLVSIREFVQEITTDLDRGEDPDYHDIDGLVDHVNALDEWLSKGGYLPADWQGRK